MVTAFGSCVPKQDLSPAATLPTNDPGEPAGSCTHGEVTPCQIKTHVQRKFAIPILYAIDIF